MLGVVRDQPNSRFHGRDIFHEIGRLPWKMPISVKFREARDFSWILTLLPSFVKVFRVLSTAFVWILLFAKCHNSALSSWHVFTVLLTSHHSRSTRLLPYFATDSCASFVMLWYLSIPSNSVDAERSVSQYATPLSVPHSARDCQQATWQIK